MFRTLFAAALIATAPYAAPASADTAAFSCPAKGTVITTTDGDLIEHQGQTSASDATICRYRLNRRPQKSLFGGLWTGDASTANIGRMRDIVANLYPLAVGSVATGTVYEDQDGYVWFQRLKVVRTETVRIGDTIMEAFVIEHTETSTSGNTELLTTHWQTHDGLIVKQTSQRIRGNYVGPTAQVQSWEAESITLPPPP